MAGEIKNYGVTYEINSTGNASVMFENMSKQALAAQENIATVLGQVKKIDQYLKTLTRNEALKNIWNIKPTIDLNEAKSSLKTLEDTAAQSAKRIQRIMSSALAGVSKGGLFSAKDKAALEKQMKEAEQRFSQLTNGRYKINDEKTSKKRLTKDARQARNEYLAAEKELAKLAALEKSMQAPQAVTTVNNLANKSSQISTAAKAVGNLQKALDKFGTIKGSKPITVDANIKPALSKINQLITTINTAVTALPVNVTDKAVNKAGKAIASTGKLTKTGKANVAAASSATISPATTGKAVANAQSQTIAQLQERIAAQAKQLQAKANETPISLRTRLLEDGNTGYQLSLHIGKLQKMASEHPVLLKAQLSANSLNAAIGQINKGTKGKNAPTQTVNLKTSLVPGAITAQLNKIAGEARKIASGVPPINLKVGVQKGSISTQLRKIIADAQRLAPSKKGLRLNVKATINANALTTELSKAINTLQAEANKRPISIKSTLNGSNLISQLNSTVKSLEAAVSKFSSVRLGQSSAGTRQGAITGEKAGGRARAEGGAIIAPMSSGRRYGANTRSVQSKPGFYNRIRAELYPFTGNTSFGARTPMMVDMAKGMGTMFAVGGAMSAVGSSVGQAVQYQNQMRTVKAILENGTDNYTPAGFTGMEHTVRNVGKETKFTAPEVASAARFMAMAGLDTPAINAAIRPIADIALIGDTDLGATADKLTNVMTTFNIAPEKMRDVADIMTSTFTRTNTDMMMLAESTKYAGGIANLYGGNFKNNFADVMAMFGVLGNAGIQASSAGTTIRMMYQNLMQPNKNQYATLQKFGIYTRDKQGHPLEMADIIHQIHNKVPKDQMADAIGSMFRITAQPGAAALAAHVDTLDRIIQANRAAAGTNISGNIANEKKNTISGLWAQVTSTFTEGVVQAFENREGGWAKMLMDLRDYLAKPETVKIISTIIDLVEKLAKVMAWFAKIWATVYSKVPRLVNAWMYAQLLFTQLGYLMTPIVSLVGVFTSLKNIILALARAGSAASVSLGGGGVASGAYQATRFGAGVVPPVVGGGAARTAKAAKATGNAYKATRFASSGFATDAAMMVTYQTAASRKMKYEMARNRLRNSVNYHGHGVDVSPLWYAPMSSFGSNPKEAQRFMSERSRFAGTDIYERQAMAQRADAAALRQQRIMQEQLRSMRRPEQLANDALMMRYATMYGGQKGANPNWVAQGNAVKAQRAAAFETRRAEQLANKELLRRFYMQGGKGALGMGMKGAFQRGINMGTPGLNATSLFSSIKAGFFSLMTGLAKAVGLLVSPLGLAAGAVTLFSTAIYKKYEWEKKRQEEIEAADKYGNWGEDANKKLQNAQLEGNLSVANISPIEIGYAKQKSKDEPQDFSLSNNPVVSALLTQTDTLTGSAIINRYLKNSEKFLPKEEFKKYQLNNEDYIEEHHYGTPGAALTITTNANKQESARKYGVIAQWGQMATEQADFKQAIIDVEKALYDGNTKRAKEIVEAYKPKSYNRMFDMASAKNISEITDPTKYYEWQNAQYQNLQDTLNTYIGPAQYRKQAYEQIKIYKNAGAKSRSNFEALELVQNLVQGWAVRFNGTTAAITLDNMGRIDWIALANSVNDGIPFTIQEQYNILKGVLDAIYNDPNVQTCQGINQLLDTYLPQIANQKSPWFDPSDWNLFTDQTINAISGNGNSGLTNNSTTNVNIPQKNKQGLMTSITSTNWATGWLPPKDQLTQAINDSGGHVLSGTALYAQRFPDRFPQATTPSPKIPAINATANGTNRKPHSTNRNTGSHQKDYASTYGRNAPRPTQVIINIDNLARFDRTAIAKNAEEKDIIEHIQKEITEAIMMLASTGLNEAGSIISQGTT